MPQCNNRVGLDKELGVKRSYYSFPNEQKKGKLRRLWERAVRRVGWKPRSFDKVCSDHFIGGM